MQVDNIYFGAHTIIGMQNLILQGRAVDYRTAYAMVGGLNAIQALGVSNYQLTRTEVLNPSFGVHTTIGMEKLVSQRRAVDYRTAYAMLAGLSAIQFLGVTDYQLTRTEVLNPSFGAHTINAILSLVLQGRAVDYRDAYAMVEGLTNIQTLYVSECQLTRAEVLNPNFGAHTINVMLSLVLQGRAADYRAAYAMVAGLNAIQALGVSNYQLTRTEVLNPSFGVHTTIGMEKLVSQRRAVDYRAAYAMVAGLNAIQFLGVTDYQLTRTEVLNPSFGVHTAIGMEELVLQNRAVDDRTAYAMVAGLTNVQALGVSEYKLTRKQVENKSYNQLVFETMKVLHMANPEVELLHLYETAMNIQVYQMRGIAEHNLSLDQVGIGIGIVKNKFVQKQPENSKFSENTVNVMEFLSSENLDLTQQEIYNSALELNTKQAIGLIDFGLSLKQVNSKQFKNSAENMLAELFEQIKEESKEDELKEDELKEDEGIYFLLSKQQKTIARKTIDQMMTPINTNQKKKIPLKKRKRAEHDEIPKKAKKIKKGYN